MGRRLPYGAAVRQSLPAGIRTTQLDRGGSYGVPAAGVDALLLVVNSFFRAALVVDPADAPAGLHRDRRRVVVGDGDGLPVLAGVAVQRRAVGPR